MMGRCHPEELEWVPTGSLVRHSCFSLGNLGKPNIGCKNITRANGKARVTFVS